MKKRMIPGYRRAFFFYSLPFVLLLMISAITFLSTIGNHKVLGYTSAALFAAALVALKIFELIHYRTFRCIECRRKCERPKVQDGHPISFQCHHCQIIWDTGIKPAEDSV